MPNIQIIIDELATKIAEAALQNALLKAELEEANEKIRAFENQPEAATTIR